METIQVVIGKKLLQAADRAARKTKQYRSALSRNDLRRHLGTFEVRSLEESDRQGYARRPQIPNESILWDAEAAWPAE